MRIDPWKHLQAMHCEPSWCAAQSQLVSHPSDTRSRPSGCTQPSPPSRTQLARPAKDPSQHRSQIPCSHLKFMYCGHLGWVQDVLILRSMAVSGGQRVEYSVLPEGVPVVQPFSLYLLHLHGTPSLSRHSQAHPLPSPSPPAWPCGMALWDGPVGWPCTGISLPPIGKARLTSISSAVEEDQSLKSSSSTSSPSEPDLEPDLEPLLEPLLEPFCEAKRLMVGQSCNR